MSLRHTLLALLDWVPLHGYALREAAKGFSWLHPMTNANIYPALRKLEKAGLIEHEEQIVAGRLRKIYSTTEEGQAEVRRWLSDPANDSGVFRDPRLLKICLMREASRERARDWILKDIERCQEVIEQSTPLLGGEGQARLPKYTRLVADHGLDMLRLRIEFLNEVLAEFDAEGQQEPRRAQIG
jgi:DNA-binding PadR family transcriptional regulator